MGILVVGAGVCIWISISICWDRAGALVHDDVGDASDGRLVTDAEQAIPEQRVVRVSLPLRLRHQSMLEAGA